MGFMNWRVKSAEVLQQGGVIAPDERLPWPQTAVMGVQHVIAMFGATVLAPAAVNHVAAAAHHVEAFGQAGVAARAGHALGQGLVLVGAVLVQQAKQLDHRLGRELEVFVPVKP